MVDNELLREISSYPITEFFKVEITDVDNVMYFNGNVGESIKQIDYRDSAGNLLRREVFTYEEIAGDAKNVKFIYSAKTDKFLGGHGANAIPTTTIADGWYFINTDVVIGGVNYYKNNIIGYIDVGYGNYQWRKCKLNSDNSIVEV